MSSPDFEPEVHPMWEGAIVGFLYAVEHGLICRESDDDEINRQEIIMQTGKLVLELVQADLLADLGELQAYLRRRQALIQLIAKPFDRDEFEVPGVRCLDMKTKQSRGHWLMVSLGYNGGETEAQTQLRALAMSNDVNETALRLDTGMLVRDPPLS